MSDKQAFPKSTLKVNGSQIDSDLSSLSYSYSLEDSIHSTFCKGEFRISDQTSLMKESGLLSEGIDYQFDLEFPITEDTLSTKMISSGTRTGAASTVGIFGNDMIVELISASFGKQKSSTKAYKGIASKAIKESLGKIVDLKEIEDTLGESIFFQRGLTEKEFIEQIIIPQSVASDKKSPYLVFENLKNEHYATSVDKLLKKSSKITLVSAPSNVSSKDSRVIGDLQFISQGLQKLYTISSKDGYITLKGNEETDLEMTPEFSKDSGSNLPIILENDVFSTSFVGYADPEDSNGNFALAKQLHLLRARMFQERIQITTLFCSSVLAGEMVDLEVWIQIPGEDKLSKSEYFSGKWLVEKSKHTWTGLGGQAVTKAVLARKFVTPHSKSTVKGFLV